LLQRTAAIVAANDSTEIATIYTAAFNASFYSTLITTIKMPIGSTFYATVFATFVATNSQRRIPNLTVFTNFQHNSV
jgi:hypothetical protein